MSLKRGTRYSGFSDMSKLKQKLNFMPFWLLVVKPWLFQPQSGYPFVYSNFMSLTDHKSTQRGRLGD